MEILTEIHRLLTAAGVEYALIGAHAVNVWTEPRFTADIDIVAVVPEDRIDSVKRAFAEAGFRVDLEQGPTEESRPDFLRFVSAAGDVLIEVQISKTKFQDDVVKRAMGAAGDVRVATPEDLVVMKLIAWRPKDRIDIEGLLEIHELDLPYIERLAREWDVADRLQTSRSER